MKLWREANTEYSLTKSCNIHADNQLSTTEYFNQVTVLVRFTYTYKLNNDIHYLNSAKHNNNNDITVFFSNSQRSSTSFLRTHTHKFTQCTWPYDAYSTPSEPN